MNSIYIESKTLYDNKPAVEWLDKCGARWGSGEKFSEVDGSILEILARPDNFVWFNYPIHKSKFSYGIAEDKHTHTPTALEFCQGVARILGIPEPTFGEDKDKAFWDSEQAIIDRAAKNPMVIDPNMGCH